MSAVTPIAFDFIGYPLLQSLVVDSLERIAAEKRYLSRSANRTWRKQIKEDTRKHPEWEDMVWATALKCEHNMFNQ